MLIPLDAEAIASKSILFSPSQSSLDTQIGQTLERIELVTLWGIKEGDVVLELGCGQGDTTSVLATAVGESGKVIAIDPAPLDYGTPPLWESQARLKENFPGRIDFKCPCDPIEYLSTEDASTIYDVAILAHCIWYFSGPFVLLETLRALSKRAKRICLAEWALETKKPSAFPHILAAFAIAMVSSHDANTAVNIRSILSPKEIKKVAEDAGLVLISQSAIVPPEGAKGMKDGMWEVQYALGQNFKKKMKELEIKDKEKGVIQAILDATAANMPTDIKDVASMDVWSGVFASK